MAISGAARKALLEAGAKGIKIEDTSWTVKELQDAGLADSAGRMTAAGEKESKR